MIQGQSLQRRVGAERAETSPGVRVFLQDSGSEAVIRQCLGTLGVEDPIFKTGNVANAAAVMASEKSPRLLIIDIGGIEDPLNELRALAEVCDPNVAVIAIGDRNDIAFYRELKGTGITDYFVKPVFRELFTGACKAIMFPDAFIADRKTGKLVFVLGVRGGVGATTITTNLAWTLAEAKRRHTVLIDLGLQSGDAALQLDTMPNHALCDALTYPERVDKLFLERGLKPVTSRLSLLASLEPLNSETPLSEESLLWLLDKLLPRYRVTLVEIPPAIAMRMIWALSLPGTCLLVSSPTLAGARDIARWHDAIGPNTPARRTLTIVNHTAVHGAISPHDFQTASGITPDVTVPYSREIAKAAPDGIKAMQNCAGFQRSLLPILREITGDAVSAPGSSFLDRLRLRGQAGA